MLNTMLQKKADTQKTRWGRMGSYSINRLELFRGTYETTRPWSGTNHCNLAHQNSFSANGLKRAPIHQVQTKNSKKDLETHYCCCRNRCRGIPRLQLRGRNRASRNRGTNLGSIPSHYSDTGVAVPERTAGQQPKNRCWARSDGNGCAVYPLNILVPALPASAGSSWFSEQMIASPPCFANEMHASTFGFIEPREK